MTTTIFSNVFTSNYVAAAAVGACIILAVIKYLTDFQKKPVIGLLSRHVVVFMVPLLIVFVYTVGMRVAKILVH
jgi:hypothetical protein